MSSSAADHLDGGPTDTRRDPARRYQVAWTQDFTASTPREAAEKAADQAKMSLVATDLDSGEHTEVVVERGDWGPVALRAAADDIESRFALRPADFQDSIPAVVNYLRSRADALAGDRRRDGLGIDPEVLEQVLVEQVGKHATEEIFAALDTALGTVDAPDEH